MATEIKANMVMKDGSSSRGKSMNLSLNNNNKKKVESSSSNKQILDSKQKSVTKSETKEKTTPSSSKTTTSTTTTTTKTTAVKVRLKKVFTLPGQKYDPPEEREPLRIFYESLSNQIPSSEMAEFWMMEHGLLSPERAKRAYERKQKSKQQVKMVTHIKSPATTSRAESSQKQQVSRNDDLKAKKRMASDSDDDDEDEDFIMKHKKGKG